MSGKQDRDVIDIFTDIQNEQLKLIGKKKEIIAIELKISHLQTELSYKTRRQIIKD